MAPQIVTVGGLVIDWVMTADGQVNKHGCGGNALYSAAGARLWTSDVAAVSCCGNDFPDEYLLAFEQAGVDLSGIRRLDQPHHSLMGFQYDQAGRRHVYSDPDVLAHWGEYDGPTMLRMHARGQPDRPPWWLKAARAVPEQLPASFWDAKGFHLATSSYSTQGPFVKRLYERGIPFTLDPGTDMTRARLRAVAAKIPAFLPSEVDVAAILGHVEPEPALTLLHELGTEVVALKLGPQGSIVYDPRTQRTYRVPAFPVAAKDPTGAGDSYCGGFLAGWLETDDPVQAALRGTVSASFIVEEFDARYALRFTRVDAEKRLRDLKRLMD